MFSFSSHQFLAVIPLFLSSSPPTVGYCATGLVPVIVPEDNTVYEENTGFPPPSPLHKNDLTLFGLRKSSSETLLRPGRHDSRLSRVGLLFWFLGMIVYCEVSSGVY
jgi:hypothetical protein